MLFIGLLSAAALAGRAYGYYWWTTGRYFRGTDDGYVGGNITPIAPHISGFVAQIAVTDNQEVKAGQLLVRLDDCDVRAAADHAEAVLKQREATLASLRARYVLQQSTIEQATADVDAKTAQADFAKVDAERYRLLARTNSDPQQDSQRADSINEAARAALNSARAGLARPKSN
jgi:membrane fusion protein, multidrug efflux system